MTLAQQYLEYLTEEGFRPTLDEAGDVRFRCEGGTYYIILEESDPTCFRLLFPGFWEIESEEERVQALQAASEVCADLKAVKVYLARGDTHASVELFLPDERDFPRIFERSLRVLQAGVRSFRSRMQTHRQPSEAN
ncbi:hypothetical protein HNR42_000517 [Deinobacterium chartae]|uniref:Sensory transduction regulator n=1 Tax=Deinobacterium chartae TaxID=521158 RepID=A0A841HW85_9DEIO|nr:hypothetical protein [Deinobacterium chartae]MBB6097103.1 hypothetical protein [Deinobacterium chartae]